VPENREKIMPKKMPLRGQLLNKKSSPADSMSAQGSNWQLCEEMLSGISAEDEQAMRESQAVEMEKSGGYSAQTIELMRNPQPLPVKPTQTP
jgi:hypothetical protein